MSENQHNPTASRLHAHASALLHLPVFRGCTKEVRRLRVETLATITATTATASVLKLVKTRQLSTFCEEHGIKAGDVNIGVETTQSERVSPIISVVLIAGIAPTVGARMRSFTK
jgi:hypothetical protein